MNEESPMVNETQHPLYVNNEGHDAFPEEPAPRAVDGFWIEPRGSRVVVEQRAEKRRRSTVIHEVSAGERPHEGVVVALGPLVKGLNLGDSVLFHRFAGQEGVVPLNSDKTLVILEDDEVIARMDEGALEAAEKALQAEDATKEAVAEDSLARMRAEARAALEEVRPSIITEG
ncbi:MAG: hypothetical protein IPL77_11045 [Flavobacteriales bacterium]|nr:hypothetical protein [Flavobacteriales bacterium]